MNARRRSRIAVIPLLAAVVAVLTLTPATQQPATAQDAAPPNIIIINTDDQRSDYAQGFATGDPMIQEAMPVTYSQIAQKGVTFPNGFVDNPLCAPSRASMLTGTYTHTNGVWNDQHRDGGWRAYVDGGWEDNSAGVWLQSAGYRTALIGKYINQYQDGSHEPPGWDDWFAITGKGGVAYYGFNASVNGVPKSFGPNKYAATIESQRAAQFISSTPESQPLYLYWAPAAPHRPYTPETQADLDRFSNLAPYQSPSVNEANVSDKPAYIRAIPKADAATVAGHVEDRVEQYASLASVDRGVARILDALDAAGRTSNTFIVFTSDNGIQWGEHRYWGKDVPYDGSVRVPFVVRYDPLTSGAARVDPSTVMNIDITPTALALAGATSTTPMDGRNLVPLLAGTAASWRTRFLVEHGTGKPAPPFCSARADQSMFVRYATGEEEYYDYNDDPYETTNGIHDPAYRAARRSLSSYASRHCVPPG